MLDRESALNHVLLGQWTGRERKEERVLVIRVGRYVLYSSDTLCMKR